MKGWSEASVQQEFNGNNDVNDLKEAAGTAGNSPKPVLGWEITTLSPVQWSEVASADTDRLGSEVGFDLFKMALISLP